MEKFNPENYPKRKKEYTEPVAVNFVNGAYMFFRTKVFAEVGGFDTSIFLYFEEMDICYRLLKKGYKSVLFPEAKITHYQGVSTGVSKLIKKEAFISYLYVTRKNYSLLKFLSIYAYYSFTFLFKPKKWYLLSLVLQGGSLKKSLRHKQQLNFNILF